MRLLVTRPEPDASREAEALGSRGHQPVLAPLLTIEFTGPVPLQLDGAQALIVTSRNALRALAAHPELGAALTLPLFAVGEGSARLAQELGFADVTIGPGTGAELAALMLDELKPGKGAVVHLAGETLAFDLKGTLEKEGFAMRAPVLYRATPLREFPAEAAALLASGELEGVILMSPRTARTFAALFAALRPVRKARGLVCYCLSKAVADAVIALGVETRVAAGPREEDVLALLDSEAASS
jgi:uroporphyrinogen-III synthase